MNDVKDKRDRLRLVLAEAYRRKPAGNARPSPAWRKGVMRRLTESNGLSAWMDPWAVMERLVWRLAPAAGALALLLALLVGLTDADPAADLAGLITADTADAGLYTFYQSESLNE